MLHVSMVNSQENFVTGMCVGKQTTFTPAYDLHCKLVEKDYSFWCVCSPTSISLLCGHRLQSNRNGCKPKVNGEHFCYLVWESGLCYVGKFLNLMQSLVSFILRTGQSATFFTFVSFYSLIFIFHFNS